MTAFSSGLKVLMISAQGTEEEEGRGRERGQRGETVKECRDKRASRGRNHRRRAQVISSPPTGGAQVGLFQQIISFRWEVCGRSGNILTADLRRDAVSQVHAQEDLQSVLKTEADRCFSTDPVTGFHRSTSCLLHACCLLTVHKYLRHTHFKLLELSL